MSLVNDPLPLSGADKVILVTIGVIAIVVIAAIVGVVVSPLSKDTIIPMMSLAIGAIATLAARHPPTVAPGTITPPLLSSDVKSDVKG